MAQIMINYAAIVVAAAFHMVLGGFWYSQGWFGKKWIALQGFSAKKVKEMHKKNQGAFGWAAVFALLTSFVLACAVRYVNAITIQQGAATGFWLWLGFIATTTSASFLWEGKPKQLWVLNNAYSLVSLLVMGAILAVWI